jgi:hypothetical protein
MDVPNRQAVFQALSEFTKNTEFGTDEITKMISETESDRGIVVILGSITEDQLLRRIFENLIEPMPGDLRRSITKTGGVLGSWAARTHMAQALGIINEDDAAILEVMKAMRNACAHSRRHIDFQTAQLKDVLCLALNTQMAAVLAEAEQPLAGKMTFLLLFSYISERIKGASAANANKHAQELLDGALAMSERRSASQQKRTERPRKANRPAPKGKERPRPPRSSQA